MTVLHILCGLPGSGKTTLARKLAEQTGAVVHSYDDIPNARGNPDHDGSIMRTWLAGMNADLANGKSVICDSTNLTAEKRTKLLQNLTGYGRKVLYLMDVPMAVCVSRNAQREHKVPLWQIQMLNSLKEAPTMAEGWDNIVRVGESTDI